MKNNLRWRGGFTLIELLVVMAIIAIISSVLMVNFESSRAHARDAARISDVSQLQLALSMYADRCNQYPSSLSTTAANGCPTTPVAISLGTFIAQIPTPPAGAGQTAYDYATTLNSSNQPVNYVLHAKLEYYNVAVSKGLSAMPSGTWSATYTCGNTTSSTDYCVTSN